MKTQQYYSHGLLYSVEPNDFASLHLNDDQNKDKFNWEAYESDYSGETFFKAVLSLVKTTAVGWGLIKFQ